MAIYAELMLAIGPEFRDDFASLVKHCYGWTTGGGAAPLHRWMTRLRIRPRRDSGGHDTHTQGSAWRPKQPPWGSWRSGWVLSSGFLLKIHAMRNDHKMKENMNEWFSCSMFEIWMLAVNRCILYVCNIGCCCFFISSIPQILQSVVDILAVLGFVQNPTYTIVTIIHAFTHSCMYAACKHNKKAYINKTCNMYVCIYVNVTASKTKRGMPNTREHVLQCHTKQIISYIIQTLQHRTVP